MQIMETQLVDFDSDGFLDLFVGGHGYSNENFARLYKNNGDKTYTEVSDVAFRDAIKASCVAWGDYDNNGYADVFMTGAIEGELKVRLFKNNAGTFIDVTPSNFIALHEGTADWGDYDNDGDLDLMILGMGASQHITRLYENLGNDQFMELQITQMEGRDGQLQWADYDNDNDLDLLIVANGGVSGVYRNNGDKTFTKIANPFDLGGESYVAGNADWADYDQDGDLDFVYAGHTDEFGARQRAGSVMRNDGNDQFSQGAFIRDLEVGTILFMDHDSDGDMDIISGGTNDNIELSTALHINDNGNFTEYDGFNFAKPISGIEWGDIDNDGDVDLLYYSYNNLQLLQNKTGVVNTAPVEPTGLNAAVTSDEVVLSWAAASDNETASVSLSYNVRIGTTPGGHDIVNPHTLTNGTLSIPKRGNAQLGVEFLIKTLPQGLYYWSVQTVDNNFSGSNWSAESTFLIIFPPNLNNTPIQFCQSESVYEELYAEGNSIKWYDDEALQNLMFEGNSYIFTENQAGVYSYYATQTIDGMESEASKQTIELLPAPITSQLYLKSDFILICIDSGMVQYRWFLDNQIIGDADKQFYVIPENTIGDYQVEITNEHACTNLSPIYTYNTATASVKLFPNPSTGVFTVSITNDFIGNIDYTITRQNGAIVKKSTITKANTQLKWEELDLQTGIYLIEFRMGDKKSTKTILIN